MMKHIFTLLVFSWNISFVYAQETQYNQKENINYYSDNKDDYQAEKCRLSIYYPENKENFATIVWFHGGGLIYGEREIPAYLKDKGFAVVGVGYRLSPKASVNTIIDDAAAAVAWVFNNIEKYKGNKSQIFISGHSAGGYLAMMLGLNKEYLAKYHIDANKLAGLIPFSGQMISHFTARAELNISDKQPIIDKMAPLYWIRKDTPPILLITGDRELELLGRYEENAYFKRMMQVIGNDKVQLLELQGYGHDMVYPAFPLLVAEVKRVLKN